MNAAREAAEVKGRSRALKAPGRISLAGAVSKVPRRHPDRGNSRGLLRTDQVREMNLVRLGRAVLAMAPIKVRLLKMAKGLDLRGVVLATAKVLHLRHKTDLSVLRLTERMPRLAALLRQPRPWRRG